MNKRHSYQTNRYTPGVWNGLGGWTHCAQYFNMESSERVAAMMDIAELLRKNGIEFVATIWKKYCRLIIPKADCKAMPEVLKTTIANINASNTKNW